MNLEYPYLGTVTGIGDDRILEDYRLTFKPVLTTYTITAPSTIPEPEPPTWEDLVTQAIEASTIKDAMQWLLGDIANVVIGQPVIGRPAADSDRQTLSAFARDVGKVSASSMQEYAAIARAFPAKLRDYDNLSYSHYRSVYRRLKDSPERFEEWLEAASVEGWSIEKLQAELGSTPQASPKPPIRTESHHMPLADLPNLFSTVDRWHARHVEVSYHADGKIVMVVMP